MNSESDMRLLVVNADDFGRSPGINRGIIEAHERGIVTSASLMVRWPASGEAAEYARARPELGVGLHVDIGEWAYGSDGWQPVYEVVAGADPAVMAEEVERQIARFESLTGRPPTHLDSHQHAHRSEPLRGVLRATAERLGVPLRHYAKGIRHCGDFHGQSGNGDPYPEGVSVENLVRLLRALGPGVTELGCHPGLGTEGGTYGVEREREVESLCDARVRTVIAAGGIRLGSFSDPEIAQLATAGDGQRRR